MEKCVPTYAVKERGKKEWFNARCVETKREKQPWKNMRGQEN